MKKVTVYQTTNEQDFANNMLASAIRGRSFTPIHRMEKVVMLRQNGEDSDILEELFEKLNDEEYKYSINYSMSVGDIVRIDNTYYRCTSFGWEDISAEC